MTKKKDLITFKNRPCNARKSKINSTAYTKDELVKLAVKTLKYSESKSKRKTKDELCNELSKKPTAKKVMVKKSSTKKPTSKKTATKKVTVEKSSTKKSSTKKITAKKPVKKVHAPKSKSGTKKSSIKLHSYQERIAEYLLKHRGVVAAFSTGSGKTLTAINAAITLLNNEKSKIKKVLVVTSVGLISQFKKDMEKFGLDSDDRRFSFIGKEKFQINYSKGVLKCTPNMFLIIDEAHNFRTEVNIKKMNRAYCAIACSKKVNKVLLLTATPIYNSPYDVVNLVAMVKGESPITKKTFYAMKDSDKEKYFKCVFSFYKNPKDHNYPTLKEESIPIKMTPQYQKSYNNVEVRQINPRGENVYGDTFDPFAFLTGIRQATNSLQPCLKCIWVADKLLTEKRKTSVIKTILYSSFNDLGIEIMKKTLNDNKIKFLEITGKIKKELRKEYIDKFNNHFSGINVLLLSKAGNEGLDLKGVRNVIILEAGYNRAGEEQIIGRAVRYESHNHLPTNERNTTVYYLVMEKLDPDPETKKRPKYLSADQILKQLIDKKLTEDLKIKPLLVKQSIENQSC